MICKACNFENKDGAAFCVSCGKPLTTENAGPVEPMKGDDKTVMIDPVISENKLDDSESNTTVLTNNMVNTPGPATPGFGAIPNNAPMNGMPMGMPMNGTPNGMPMNNVPKKPG